MSLSWRGQHSFSPAFSPSFPPTVSTGGGLAVASSDFRTSPAIPAWLTFSRAGSAWATNASGALTQAGTNAARFDYDPATLAAKGLLLETTSRTNMLKASGDLSDANWQKLSAGVAAPIVTGNFTTAPDATTTAAKVVFPAVSGAGNRSLVSQLSPTLTAASHKWEIWLKGSVGGEQLYLFGTPNESTYFRQLLTLTTAWVRYSTAAVLTAAPWYFAIGRDYLDGSQGAIAAQTIYAWGGQAELGAFPMSYISTTTSTATRAVDSLSAGATYSSNPAIIQVRDIATGTRSRKKLATLSAISSEVDEWIEAVKVYPVGTSSAWLDAHLVVDGAW